MKHFIITPVGNNCNLYCDYCYHSNLQRNDVVIMKEEILEKFIRESLNLFEAVRYTWHGGEPTLAGLSFFQKAVDLQKKYKKENQKITNGIQTNATLINDQWGEFLAENNFYVSTTLDGPQKFHNLYRNNSYAKVMNGIKILSQYVKRVGIILVINDKNVYSPKEIYDFFCSQSWFSGFELHPCMPIDRNSNNFVPKEDDLLNFMCTIFDLWWEQDNPKIQIRSCNDIIRVLVGDYPKTCLSQKKGCMHIASIDYDGNVYTCSRFMQEKKAILGNILKSDLSDFICGEKAEDIYKKMINVSEKCLSCEWFDFCGGGCAYQKLLSDYSDQYQCRTRRRFFEYVVPKIKEAI